MPRSRMWSASVPLFLAAMALAPRPARAEEWVRTYPVKTDPELTLVADDARIRVRSWDRQEIEVRVTYRGFSLGGDHAPRIVDQQDGDHVRFELRERRFSFSIGFVWNDTEVAVSVPRRSTLDLETGDGSVDVANVEGDVTIHSGDGRVLASDIAGRLSLDTSDGSIEVTNHTGDLRAHTGDGHISIDGMFRHLELSSSDGRIEAVAKPGSAPVDGWDIETADGRITLRVPATLAADLDARTSDGRITVDLPVEVQGRLDHSSIRGRMNGGGPPICIRTHDGSIRVEQL